MLSEDFAVSLPRGEIEQDKAEASTGLLPHITGSAGYVASILYFTGSMHCGTFTLIEEELHLSKSHEQVTSASYHFENLISEIQLFGTMVSIIGLTQ